MEVKSNMKSYPNIPVVYEGRVRSNFVNDIDGWSLTREEVESSKGKLLHLDVDYGTMCSLNCPMCFRKNGTLDMYEDYFNIDRLKKAIHEGKGIGLKCVRILGAGEPFQNKGIFELLQWLNEEELKSVIFTQGHALNQNTIRDLSQLDISIMMRYDSFDDKIVAHSTGTMGLKQRKDRTLEALVKAGFNAQNPTRLGIVAPITQYTADGIVEIYQFFRDRNIYPLIPFLACAGRSLNPDGTVNDDISEEKKLDIVTSIYDYNFRRGVPYDGISAYPGTHICTLLSNGFYLTWTGLALRCEGDDVSVVGDLRVQSLKEIWEQSENNRKFGGRYNYGCPPKIGKSIPPGFFKKVEQRLIESGLIIGNE